MYICIYVYMYKCLNVYMYICVYVYMYICTYVYMWDLHHNIVQHGHVEHVMSSHGYERDFANNILARGRRARKSNRCAWETDVDYSIRKPSTKTSGTGLNCSQVISRKALIYLLRRQGFLRAVSQRALPHRKDAR